MVGIDHIFIYDNSSQGKSSFIYRDVTDQFLDKVTRICWCASFCINNHTFYDSPGERSSQYAAELSSQLRFGPYTEWIANFDNDENITPVRNYTSIK